MDIKEIKKRIINIQKELTYLMEQLEEKGVEADKTFGIWLKYPDTGAIVYRTGHSSGFGWNSIGKWIDNDTCKWSFGFVDDESDWVPVEPLEIAPLLTKEVIARYCQNVTRDISMNVQKDGTMIFVDGKEVLDMETGKWKVL